MVAACVESRVAKSSSLKSPVSGRTVSSPSTRECRRPPGRGFPTRRALEAFEVPTILFICQGGIGVGSAACGLPAVLLSSVALVEIEDTSEHLELPCI
jgi:hypothetical protein